MKIIVERLGSGLCVAASSSMVAAGLLQAGGNLVARPLLLGFQFSFRIGQLREVFLYEFRGYGFSGS